MSKLDSNNYPLVVGSRVKIVRDATRHDLYVGLFATVTSLGARDSDPVLLDIESRSGKVVSRGWSWSSAWLERVEAAEKRPSERVANLLQEWHRASQFSDQPGEVARIGDALIDALLVEHGLPNLDTAGSASRQHYIETGRYLYEGEEF